MQPTNWSALCQRIVALGRDMSLLYTVRSWSTDGLFALSIWLRLKLRWRSVELWALSLCTKDFLLGASPFSYEESMGHQSVAMFHGFSRSSTKVLVLMFVFQSYPVSFPGGTISRESNIHETAAGSGGQRAPGGIYEKSPLGGRLSHRQRDRQRQRCSFCRSGVSKVASKVAITIT